MVTIDHECYVDLEVAKLLEKAGFDWVCRGNCVGGDVFTDGLCGTGVMNNSEFSVLRVPALDVAQRWLREEKGVEVNVICVYINHIKKYSYTAFTNEYEHEIIDEGFGTYEEAQDAGIKKVLETILQIANAE